MYKIEEIIEALLYFADSQEIRTKIVKACYLLESEYFDKTGKRLTNVEYKYHYYGPYSETIVEAMEKDENIMCNPQISMNGNDYILYMLKKTSVISEIDPLTLSFIEKWAKIMKQMTPEKIKKIAYEDKNFKRTARGKIINLESDFLRKKELLKERVKVRFGSRNLSKEELEGLNKDIDEDLLKYSMQLLSEPNDHSR